jgi:hypothetical protein
MNVYLFPLWQDILSQQKQQRSILRMPDSEVDVKELSQENWMKKSKARMYTSWQDEFQLNSKRIAW